MSPVIGIDPGATGAVAFLSPDGTLLAVEDIPVDTVTVGKGNRSRVSVPRLLALLKGASGSHAFIEQPTYRPMTRPNAQTGVPEASRMGAAGAGAFGEAYGCVLTACVASGCAVREVRPGAWSRAIGLKGGSEGKDNSRRMAADLFPASAHLFARKKDNGRSDAALIGYWGAREMRGGRA